MEKRIRGLAFACFLSLGGHFAVAQSFSPTVLATGGGRVSTPEMTLDWTLGEPLASDVSIGAAQFTEGFEQPFLKIEIVESAALTVVERSAAAENATFSMACWPNPTTSTVSARIDSKEWGSAIVQLTDAAGRTLQKMARATNAEFEVDLGACPNGQYFLHFFSPEGQSLGARKITLIR